MVQLITNGPSSMSHLGLLKKILDDAEEVYIAVAFLKTSGVKWLLPYFKKDIYFKIIAGVNFGITDPDALTLLYNQNISGKVQGYISSLNSKTVFHPKMYLVRSGDTGHVLIGSANLTSGGFEDNNECSLHYTCRVGDPTWADALGYFQKCILPENADLLGKRVIAIYREYHKKQKAANRDCRQFPDVEDNLIYDLKRLKWYFDKENKSLMRKGFREKAKYYTEAREILESIRRKKLRPEVFKENVEELVGRSGQRGLWHSNGMFRHKTAIFDQQETFRQLIDTIKKNLDKRPGFIYDEAKRVSDQIFGVGPNFIGEIMMTYAPDKLANINRNPITVLREEGGMDIKSHSQSFSGEDYEEYNSIVGEIAHKLGLGSMLEADYFFNSIYQQIKQTRQSSN